MTNNTQLPKGKLAYTLAIDGMQAMEWNEHLLHRIAIVSSQFKFSQK
jgi:hypothetical protein